MLHELLNNKILPALIARPYVDRIGGLVHSAARVEQDGGNPSVFPMCCGAPPSDCNVTGMWSALTPDDGKKSVLFFRKVSEDFDRLQIGSYRHNVALKMLFWANFKKLGISACYMPFPLIVDLLKTVNRDFTDFGFGAATANVTVTDLNDHDYQKDWGMYTAFDESLFLYPYGFAVFNLRITFNYSQSCVPDFVPAPEIECMLT